MKLTPDEAVVALNTCITSMVMDHLLTEISRTSMFKQGIKFHSKGLAKELKPIIEGTMQELFEVDDTAAGAAWDNMIELLKNVTKIRPEQWQLITYASKWANNPDSLMYAKMRALCIEDDVNSKR